MQLFIDSASIKEVKVAALWGIIDGVTTNPSLVAKEGGDFKKTVLEICKIVNGPVSAEVMSLEADKIIKEAKVISQWHKNVVIKIPCSSEGLKAIGQLSKLRIKTNATLVFSANQVLTACKAGATFISPFVGRLDDAGQDGMLVIEEAMRIITNYNFSSKIIVASIRSAISVKQAALLGASIATVPFKILEQLFCHPLTDAGIKKFTQDWASLKK